MTRKHASVNDHVRLQIHYVAKILSCKWFIVTKAGSSVSLLRASQSDMRLLASFDSQIWSAEITASSMPSDVDFAAWYALLCVAEGLLLS